MALRSRYKKLKQQEHLPLHDCNSLLLTTVFFIITSVNENNTGKQTLEHARPL